MLGPFIITFKNQSVKKGKFQPHLDKLLPINSFFKISVYYKLLGNSYSICNS